MGLEWKKENLDLSLVPMSLYLRNPDTTVIGYENYSKRTWVEKMFTLAPKDRPATSVLGNNISAASNLSSITLVMSSLIGAWLGSSDNIFSSSFVYGDTSRTVMTIKYVSLLVCFLVAFGAFVQTTRCFVHASYLLTIPDEIPTGYVEREVIRGSHFYEFGMRALYFAMTFLVWAFGPIPMLVTSIVLVILLNFLDTNTKPLLHVDSEVHHHHDGAIIKIKSDPAAAVGDGHQ
ncbi:OLC1v1023153C1 [Oldenlandia corymbosa var. corymbosa]|uniref:OLC1v1023153C1 n=1 Tax=Oldenlandia corymbosa var. corymbosa TaxID=529605 RepID=A0AAV1C005_OLDCO|nr:OLC1v1023153C1 [Oldenlandia corymbosa var. corymbosa]